MSFSVVGIIVLAYSAKLAICNSRRLMQLAKKCAELSVVACLFFDVGYVFKVAGFECEYNYFFTFISFIAIILYARRIYISKSIKIYFLLLLYLIVIVAMHTILGTTFLSSSYSIEGGWEGAFSRGTLDIIHNSMKQIIMPTIRMIIFGGIVIFLSQEGKQESLHSIAKMIHKASIYYMFLIIFEFIMVNFGGIMVRESLITIFGQSSSTSMNYRLLFGLNIPLGLSREPSSLALQCLVIFTSNLFYYKQFNKGRVVLVAYLILLLLSQSMSSIMYMLGAAYLIFNTFRGSKKVLLSFLIPLFVLIGVFLFYSLFSGRLTLLYNELTNFYKGMKFVSFNSTIIRMYSMYNNLQYFIKHPIFGTGLYSIYSFSAIITIITNFGLVGLIIYLRFYKYCIQNINEGFVAKGKLLILSSLCFLFTGMSGQLLYYPQTFYFFAISNMIFRNSIIYLDNRRISAKRQLFMKLQNGEC